MRNSPVQKKDQSKYADTGALDLQRIADADLSLRSNASTWWRPDVDSPHITAFSYDVFVDVDEDEVEDEDDPAFEFLEESEVPVRKVGTLRGYTIAHDGANPRLDVWDEADALDGEIESYVSEIKEELRACGDLFDAPSIEDFRCIVVVGDFSTVAGVDSVAWIEKAVATLARKEMPNLLLVDPRVVPDIPGRSTPTELVQASWSDAAKLKARAHADALASLGLTQMVLSDHLWGWTKGKLMKKYSRQALLAKRGPRAVR